MTGRGGPRRGSDDDPATVSDDAARLGDPTPDDGAAVAQAFYSRWARLYDALATRAPGVGALRSRAADALALEPGDRVVEMGCGTGANFPHLRDRVGPDGAVVGVDFSPGVLDRARDRIERRGWENVHVVGGDATRPPVALNGDGPSRPLDLDGDLPSRPLDLDGDLPSRPVDAVFSSFVSGMLPDPETTVRGWADLVDPAGRIAVLDLARSTRPSGAPLNPLFEAFVLAGSPPGTRLRGREATRTLDARVATAHRTVRAACDDVRYSTHALGFARLSAGTVR
ncbi:class I SAM-dependent methyltransferase [Halegenticoccus tardaugens]|uniref:class I SAM-dependent methyltransferase n=1 Tax=Halegenticoccus tardaugens TaxID=2071624 RepID=UPI00100B32E4|nr:methyltransferase domain-containing protein [Halegenticoccus tardaugens]